MLASLGNSY